MAELSGSVEGVVDCHGTPLWFEIRYGTLPEWFHWGISRKTAEDLLKSKPIGHFLIRVSESRLGYTLSYRGLERCKHYMIELSDDGQYCIAGENQRHRTLQDMVDFHQVTPISPHREVLTVACRQSQAVTTDPAIVLFSEKQPGRFLTPQNNLHPLPRETVNPLQSTTEPAPPVVKPVPKMRKKYLQPPLASTLSPPKGSSTSSPALSIQESRAFDHSATVQRPKWLVDPEPNNTRWSERENAEIEYLEQLYRALHSSTEGMSKVLPQEYSPPPPFSPWFKNK